MHCPQCGQPFPDTARFCRLCGFSLDEVKGLLASSGHDAEAANPPSLLNIRVGADPRSQKGLNQSAYLLLLALIPMLLAIAQGLFSFTIAPAFFLIKASLILLAIPAARFAYAVYEARQEWKRRSRPQPDEGRREVAPPLPAIRLEPGARQRVADAAEVEQPPSVTENTTELLASPEG